MSVPHKSKASPKFLFWSLVLLIMLVIQVILSFTLISIAIMLDQWFGISVNLSSYAGVLILPVYITAFTSVCAIGRREGFVKPRRTETLRRIPGPLHAASIETFELQTPESIHKQLYLGLGFVSVLIAVLAVVSDTNLTRIYAFAASGVFFTLSLLIFCFGKSEGLNFVARIDRDGVTACQGFRQRSAAWQEIEAVEIVALSGAPGTPVTRTYALFGREAKRLFIFNLLYVPLAEREKFERVLREAFEARANLSEITV